MRESQQTSVAAAPAVNQKIGPTYLRSEIQVGLFSAQVALRTGDRVKAARHQANARMAYDAVMYFLGKITLSAADRQELESGLAELQACLSQFDPRV